MQSTGPNLSCSVKLDLDLLKPWRVSAAAAAPNDQAVRAVPYSCPVRRSLRTYAWQGATLPCFLQGNATPTIPHKLRHLKASAFQYGIADAAAVDGRRGSNVYEVNPWLWQFGRGRPRLGGLSVSETEAVVRAGAKWRQETRHQREAARCGDE